MNENKIKTGSPAPNFTLQDAHENNLSLNQFKGKWVVLYFYPKDDTSGCTLEAIDFTREISFFKEHNAEVIGVSPDSCQSHQKFILKHDLDVKLLSDPEKQVLQDYGVWQIKKMYGKEHYGVVRTTLLIDPDGKIVKIWDKVNVNGHIDDVKKALLDSI